MARAAGLASVPVKNATSRRAYSSVSVSIDSDVLGAVDVPALDRSPPSARTAASSRCPYSTLRRESAVPWVMNSGRPFSIPTASSGLYDVRSSPGDEARRQHAAERQEGRISIAGELGVDGARQVGVARSPPRPRPRPGSWPVASSTVAAPSEIPTRPIEDGATPCSVLDPVPRAEHIAVFVRARRRSAHPRGWSRRGRAGR